MISSAVDLRNCTDSYYAGQSIDSRTRVFLLGVRQMSEGQQRARYASSLAFICPDVFRDSFLNCPSAGQRVCSILGGPVRLPCTPLPKTRGTELPHANSWLSCRCPRAA